MLCSNWYLIDEYRSFESVSFICSKMLIANYQKKSNFEMMSPPEDLDDRYLSDTGDL